MPRKFADVCSASPLVERTNCDEPELPSQPGCRRRWIRRSRRRSLSQDSLSSDEQRATVCRADWQAARSADPWQLVELIQRVVAPDLWDVQGGSGTIQYFAMRRVLVVRATTDVHEQIRDLLMALR